MAFDQSTRNHLQRFVSEVRELLTEEFSYQLRYEYGMDPATGEVSDLDRLTHLDDTRRETARLLRDMLDHYVAGSSFGKKECLERIVREQAFTVLNRLCALRMAEARGLLIESVANGYNSKGFQLYARLAGIALGETGDAYRSYLFSLFDELSLDLPVLFDRYSPQGRLFPRESVLLELLEKINHPEIAPLWAEDETIGWIYQYFNSVEERKKMRSEARAPRNSRELAVRNQFFTPRYVVEFLTDNTLGRTWYEMTQGRTALKEQCRYLVRYPNEIFLLEGEEKPKQETDQENLSQEELLQQPVYIPFRPLKDPREIRMLDPACGSMHFGLYAFDIFEKIYEEAWELEGERGSEAFVRSDELKPLRETYESKEALIRDIPRLIVEYNIHGIDIDPRAVQIAGLSLWLRAQRSWQEQGVKPQQRPRIRRSNVVCAEPISGEREMLREFTEQLHPRVLGQLVEQIYDKMQLAGEAGALLKIEEEIKDSVEHARIAFNEELLNRKEVQLELFPETRPPVQHSLFDFSDLPDETLFWNQAESNILQSLREYAEVAEAANANRKKMFSQDASRGFAFIDICRKRYDVVLMNPPFGEPVPQTKAYLKDDYPWIPWKDYNLLAAFVGRGIELLSEGGYLGAITSRAGLFLTTFEDWRKEVLLHHRLVTLADLGFGVMEDALVEAAAYVVGKDLRRSKEPATFLRLLKDVDRATSLAEACQESREGSSTPRVFRVVPEELEDIPGAPLAYWVSPSIRRLFRELPPLEGNGAEVRVGLQTSDDFRFVRTFWEVDPARIARTRKETFQGKCWVPFAKGGEYSPFYADIHLVVDWEQDGQLIRKFEQAVVRNPQFYFCSGITWPERTTSGFSPQVLPAGCVFSVTGPAVIPSNNNVGPVLLAILNDRVTRVIIDGLVPAGEETSSGTAARHYGVGLVQRLPWLGVALSADATECLGNLSTEIMALRARLDENDETTRRFICPDILRITDMSLLSRITTVLDAREETLLRGIELSGEVERVLHEALGLDSDAERYLDEEYGPHPASYPNEPIADEDEFARLYQMPIEKVIDEVVESRGGARTIATKSYFLDRRLEVLAHVFGCHPRTLVEARRRLGILPPEEPRRSVEALVSYLLGCAFGRWDIRIGRDPSLASQPPDPFDLVPLCPPGMLVGSDGLPAREVPEDYPLKISPDRILVDDEGHPEDIVLQVREAMEVIWKDKAGDIEQEIYEILGVRSLRDYFRKPNLFFSDHLKRYSKSRRQAPIYWPISTKSGSYTLWLYYHRLTDQTLYTCVNDFIEPKLNQVSELADRLRQKKGRSKAEEIELERLTDLEMELKELRDELLKVAAIWKPYLNDGVQITAAPLWRFFQYKPWQKKLKETWQKLEKGEYDWAHLAYSIWPDRVRKKCRKDKSLAIVHNLEDLYEEQTTELKKKRSKRT